MADRYLIKPNYVNLAEYNIHKDIMFDKFVSNSLVKKTSTCKKHISTESLVIEEEGKSEKNKECLIF